MKFMNFQKVRDGKYLKNYELTYLNKAGIEKHYEMVSRKELRDERDIGKSSSGVSIAAIKRKIVWKDGIQKEERKLLLLKEFRMGINKSIYNLCAGMIEENESIEDCIGRELYEETGLRVKRIIEILPPSYAAVAITDTMTHIAFVEAEGEIEDHTSDNEMIFAAFYTVEEVSRLLKEEEFSSRAQTIAYFFTKNPLT